MKRISVFCGSNNGLKPIYREIAYSLGQILANNQLELVYGGGHVGLMGAVADGVMESDGKVIGVIPEFLQQKELAHMNLTELIVVSTMHERKAMMNDLCDGVIVLPGGFGTLDEFFEMLTWAQLCIHKKPIGILNTDGYYNSLLTFIDEMIVQQFVKKEYRDLIIVDDDPQDLIERMKKYIPPLNEKWFVTN